MSRQFSDEFYRTLPKDFLWGVASAAYQIEGAVNEDGRGQSIWDVFSHTKGKTFGGDTGDLACDHYHRYPEDFRMMKQLGLKNYRLSIAWPRLLPEGHGTVNQKGLDFYDRLIEELLENGIDPSVTLYHWDLPNALQEKGGWANRDTAYRFEDYAGLIYRHFGDRVKRFITHNEPWCTAVLGHFIGEHAPGLHDEKLTALAAHHVLVSHGLAVQAYRDLNLDGEVGITLNLNPVYAASHHDKDNFAANIQDVFSNRWFLDPIFKGQYPAELEQVVGSLKELHQAEDLAIISRPIDFLGINFYSYSIVEYDDGSPLHVKNVTPKDRVTDMGWPVLGSSLTDLLMRLKNDYGSLPLYITENGAAYVDVLEDGKVHDPDRIDYLADHFEAMAEAIRRGVDLRGYYLWTFMDNFEWAYGYSKRFGIVYTDYATQQRIPKDSALWYADVISRAANKM